MTSEGGSLDKWDGKYKMQSSNQLCRRKDLQKVEYYSLERELWHLWKNCHHSNALGDHSLVKMGAAGCTLG